VTWVAGALLLFAAWLAYDDGSNLTGATLAFLALLVLLGAEVARDRRF
jgi:hypothetical protein